MIRCTLPLVLALVGILISPQWGYAQNREQRREFVQDLLKNLLESQLNRNNNPRDNVYPQPYPPYQPGGQFPPQTRPRPGRPVQVEVSPEMLKIRNQLNQWNVATGKLVEELRIHENKSPQLRSLFADTLKFQANVNAVNRRATLLPVRQPMINDFVALDRDWRNLSTRLKQARGLPPKCKRMIKSIADLDTKLCGLFGVQPQIDRIELARLATTLANDYDHLLRGVYFSARGKRGADALLQQGQRLQTMIGQASSLIQHGNYDTIVDAYRKCTKEWKQFSRRVLRLQDERLRYSIQHIENTGRLIQEQLWIPVELDREYLASLAESIENDTQQMFRSITLAEIMASEQPGNVLAMAREFRSSCQTLGQQLNGNIPEDQLDWSYRLMRSRWDKMQSTYSKFGLPAVDHRLEDIRFSVNSLGEIFGTEFVLSHEEIVHLYSQLDALCKQASFDIHRRVTPPKYSPEFQQQICGLGDRLSKRAFSLHRASTLPNYRPSQNDLRPLFNDWNTLRPMLAKCQQSDMLHFANFRRNLEPLMVKLQVLYSN